MNRNSLASLRPMILVFLLMNAFFVVAKNLLAKWGIDQAVVIIGNLLLFLIGLLSFFLSRRALRSPNPNAFVRAMYGNFMIKLFVCIIVVYIYIMSAKKDVSKPALIFCMGLYAVYTVIEVSSLTRILRKKKNA